jgi:hypothetical protein
VTELGFDGIITNDPRLFEPRGGQTWSDEARGQNSRWQKPAARLARSSVIVSSREY